MAHVDEVGRGRACDCFCATCRQPVLARQRKKRIWHFAHLADTSCEGESALHRAAKEVLADAASRQRRILLPSGLTPPLETATLETAIGKTRRADVLATIGGRRYGIEIRVTHAKNQAARDDYADANLEAFEIDLSKTTYDVNRHILEQMLLDGADRHWLFKRGMARRRAVSAPISPMPPPTRSDSYEQIANQICDYLVSPAGQADRFVSWPVIRADGMPRLEATAAQWERGSVMPKLYKVRRPGMFIGRKAGGPRLYLEGQVATPRGIASVDVELAFDIVEPASAQRPTLLIVCPVNLREPSWPGALFMRWYGINSWRAKLTNQYKQASKP
ncbi:competence protein CoiA family protein [Salinisphaera aquimarina]|uniref:Competence protein CoiA family protein n=1 Tax=Salinisphaera aquimarina TaxID=2094031 RepID=A0ABV7EJT2_9GAMM